jgi:hypothetical protein
VEPRGRNLAAIRSPLRSSEERSEELSVAGLFLKGALRFEYRVQRSPAAPLPRGSESGSCTDVLVPDNIGTGAPCGRSKDGAWAFLRSWCWRRWSGPDGCGLSLIQERLKLPRGCWRSRHAAIRSLRVFPSHYSWRQFGDARERLTNAS